MYHAIDLHKYINFDGLAEAIIAETGFKRTLVAYHQDDTPMLDYAVLKSITYDEFAVCLAEAVLGRAMQLRKEAKGR